VNFLVDNQLPTALVKWLIARDCAAYHVREVGLGAATDTEIWKYAAARSLVLVSKDEDFFQRASQPGAAVQVVWVRLGNCRKTALLSAFDSVWSAVQAALEGGGHVVEIR
jgi:predicted nuclease of predicted toxin-antitoxin system